MGSDKITIAVQLIIICRRILIDHHGGRLPCLVLLVIISASKPLPSIDEDPLPEPTWIFQSNSTRSKKTYLSQPAWPLPIIIIASSIRLVVPRYIFDGGIHHGVGTL